MSKLINVLLAVSIAAFLVVSGSSCGGGSGLVNSGLDQESTAFVGVSEGDFKAVRYNDRGYRDGSLNETIALTSEQAGATTVVRIGVSDSSAMYGAAFDLVYDAAAYTPVSVEFSGLVENAIELSSMAGSGIVSLGQVDTTGEKSRSGEFAVVTFAAGAQRTLSAAGDSHTSAIDSLYEPSLIAADSGRRGFEVLSNTADDSSDASYRISSTWATGDGNGDGATTIGDLTPMVAYGYFNVAISDGNFGPAATDYDANGVTNISDLTALGSHLNENTAEIEILLGDDPTFSTGDSAFATLTWAEGNAPTMPPAANTSDWDSIWHTWEGSLTQNELEAADTNEDGSVFISARTSNGTAVQAAPAGIELSYNIVVIPQGVIIEGFDLTVEGAAGGTSTFDHNSTASVTANSEVTFSVSAVNGNYNGQNFDSSDVDGIIPKADYDQALAAVEGLVETEVGLGGAAEFRYTGDVLVQSGSGNGGWTYTVFPDDDPESDNASTEGSFSISLPVTGSFVPAQVSKTVWVDVTEDATAPLVREIVTDFGTDENGNWLLNGAGNTIIRQGFDYTPIQQTDVEVQLFDFNDPAHSQDFIIVETDPQPGEAVIRQNEDPQLDGAYVVVANAGPIGAPGHVYSLRINHGVWNSVNKPGMWIASGEAPAPVEFTTIPSLGQIGPDTDHLWIFNPDPVMRRDPRLTILPDSISADDQVAFDDTIKSTGQEFSVSLYGEGVPTVFPQVIVAETDNAALISSTTVGEQGLIVVERNPGWIVVDITALTSEGELGSPTRDYSFKLFGASQSQANWPTLGEGRFDVAPMDLATSGIVVEDWGLNAFSLGNRGNANLAQRNWDDKSLDATTVGSTTPDVLFLEFAGGAMSDWNAGDPAATGNTKLIFSGVNGEYQTWIEPRAAGITAGGNLIAIHVFTAEDFSFTGNPLWEGILDPGNTYTLSLDDPQQAGIEWSSLSDELNVVGVNPND